MSSLPAFKDWPQELQRKWKEQSRKGGKNGSKADKSRAGKKGAAARIKKFQDAAKQAGNGHPTTTTT